MNTTNNSQKRKKSDKIFQAVSAALVAGGLGAAGSVIAQKANQPINEPEESAPEEHDPITAESTAATTEVHEVREIHHHHYHESTPTTPPPAPKPDSPEEQYKIKATGESKLVTLKNGEEALIMNATCNGKDAILVDFDKDGICDAIVWDKNGNGEIDPDEMEDLHELGIEIPMPIPEPTPIDIVKTGESYVIEEDGEKYVIQDGTINGHPCSFVDVDGDRHTDIIIIYNENGEPIESCKPSDLGAGVDIIVDNPPTPIPPHPYDIEIVEVVEYGQAEGSDGETVEYAQIIVSVNGKQHLAIAYDFNHDGKADGFAIDINDDGKLEKNNDFITNLQEDGQNLYMKDLAEAAGHHPSPEPEPEIDIAVTNVYQYDPENNRITADISINGETHRAIILDTDNDGIADAAAIDLNDDGNFEEGSDVIIDLRVYGKTYNMNTLAHEAGYNESFDNPDGPANDDEIIANNTGQPTKDYTGQSDNNPDYKNHSDVAMLEKKGGDYMNEVEKPNDRVVSSFNTKEDPTQKNEEESEVVSSEPHEPEIVMAEPHDEELVETMPHNEEAEIAETMPHVGDDDVKDNINENLADNGLDPMATDPMNMDDSSFDPLMA